MKKLLIKDISNINLNNTFFHYTNVNNLETIEKNGLELRVGIYILILKK